MVPAVVAAAGAAAENPLLPGLPDIIWSALCFVVLFVFFWVKVLPAVHRTLDARAAAIEGGMKSAEIAQAEAAAALEKYTEQLAEARAEAASIRDHARQDGIKILNELKEQASAEAARITANASVQIEAERQAALVSLRSEVGSLAIDLAAGVIGQTLTDDKKAASLVDQFLEDLEESEKMAR
jgi:F-type H+-transporting ATPase subunit b